jgi:hypothetical protein
LVPVGRNRRASLQRYSRGIPIPFACRQDVRCVHREFTNPVRSMGIR